MKIKKIFLCAFLIAFFLGTTFYLLSTFRFQPPIEERADKKVILAVNENLSSTRISTEISPEILVEIKNWKNDEADLKVRLLQTGEFHGMDVKERSSQNWLGLFKENEDFVIRRTAVKVSLVHDIMGSGDLTSKKVSVKNDQTPVFLLKNADFLKEGKVKTLFHSVNGISLENGLTAKYQLGERIYTLSVVGTENSAALVLESEGERQIVYSVENLGDAGWHLYWVGDLDNDGKLDLFADLNDYYNFIEPRLFLSSQAGNGKFVQLVAMFHMTGC